VDYQAWLEHRRRLTQELANVGDLTQHQARSESQVMGNEALSAEVIDSSGRVLLEHNLYAFSIAFIVRIHRGQAVRRRADRPGWDWR
jgi:hypothetical protein